ncbi:HDL176Wp [Eremothecium sinecaudum]|uniref:DNA damage checkpoint control protein RAD17 n=1 Tax=Eremothecium sinecaudum TaxID=45286 RepID=A0A109UZN2_9SACH|nr:HDL176Wp [Eremothecium sinecaudum]AMD20568.1 HDL176Wp [Eremothecium sinecaudum]
MEQSSLFSATSIHLDHITSTLNCLMPFGQKDDVLVTIDKDGLSFVRENYHSSKIQLFLSKDLFQHYCYNPAIDNPDAFTKLSIKINHIFESLSIASNRSNDDIVECTLSHNGEGTPFILIVEDSLITERAEYSTYFISDVDNTGLVLDRESLEFECIIKGDVLYSALKDLKEIGCKECYLYAMTSTRSRPIFALLSKSQLGFSKIMLPAERSILEKLEVYNNDSKTIVHESPVIGLFDFNTIDKLRLSTKIASKALIRKDVHGLLTINILSQANDMLIPNKIHSKADTSEQTVDYPSIFVEVSVLEKATALDTDIKDIQMLMSESTVQKPFSTTEQPMQSAFNAPTEQSKGNILGLTEPVNFPSEQNANDSYNPVPTMDIPLFF